MYVVIYVVRTVQLKCNLTHARGSLVEKAWRTYVHNMCYKWAQVPVTFFTNLGMKLWRQAS